MTGAQRTKVLELDRQCHNAGNNRNSNTNPSVNSVNTDSQHDMVQSIIAGVSQTGQQNADDVRNLQDSAAPADKKCGTESGSIGSFIVNRHQKTSGNNQD